MDPEPSKIVRTMCPMSCHPTLCGMLAEVRAGELVGVKGDRDNPDSQGFLCVRGQASAEVIGNPKRLLEPLVRDRRGDPFRSATWDEAFARILAAMKRRGPEASGIWPGHGIATTNYGVRSSGQLLARFANFYGCHAWSPTMICWGLGAFGLGITGLLETHTKEDMGRHAELIILWGANLASQPNTARHLLHAKRRGAYIVTIDVRHTEAGAQSNETFVIRPGTDSALALGLLHVIATEGLEDASFVARHTVGFPALRAHLETYSPAWAEAETGIATQRIVELARRYASTRPAMIVLGGSSLHKGVNGWEAARAVSCLPAVTGNVGIPGGGLGPRHGSSSHGRGLASIAGTPQKLLADPIPNQMSALIGAFEADRIDTLFLFGTNMLSSFADTQRVARALDHVELVVSYDLFLNETARRVADVVLPATAWLEEVGCKMTNTHLYLMERALQAPGQTRSLYQIVTELARRLGLEGFCPWDSEEAMLDAILDHPFTGHATIEALRAEGGMRALAIDHRAYPDLKFDTPSGRIELYSERERPLEVGAPSHPLTLTQGRTLAHFHSFYNNGQVLPRLARHQNEPELWISVQDARERLFEDGAAIRIYNDRGGLVARAKVTEKIPAGTVWMRDGWPGMNDLTAATSVLPDDAVDLFDFSAGQSSFAARVEVEAVLAHAPGGSQNSATRSSTRPCPSE